MNEIQKNWKLILASVVFVIIILIGFITLRKPDLKFHLTTEQAAALLQNPGLEILPAEVNANASSLVIVDLRTPNEFLKGNIPGSINIPEPSLFDAQNIKQFNSWENQASTIVLVGRDQSQAAGPWMLLRQMGYSNLKVMNGGWIQYAAMLQNPDAKIYPIEQPRYDFAKIMENANQGVTANPVSEKQEVVVRTLKAKNSKAEGGC